MDVYSLNKDHEEKNAEKEVGNVIKLKEIVSIIPFGDVIDIL
jgi:hypothetical protein